MENVPGLIEESDRGTLFLDELCSTTLEAQAKLLRVLETGEIRRVGETSKRVVDLRVIATVQDDIRMRLAHGELRFDLVQRLAGAVIALPPLSAREGDVILLARHFAQCLGRSLDPGVQIILGGYEWPGNVRELRLAIGRAAALADTKTIDAAAIAESIHLGAAFADPASGGESDEAVGPTVRARLVKACAANDWESDRIAKALGLGRTTLFKHLKSYGVSLRRERGAVDHRLAPR